MLTSDYIFVTKDGMNELESVLERRHDNYFRNRKVSSAEHIEHIIHKRQNPWERDVMLPILEAAESPEDQKPLDFVTPSLQQYIDDLRSLQLNAQERQKMEDLKRAE